MDGLVSLVGKFLEKGATLIVQIVLVERKTRELEHFQAEVKVVPVVALYCAESLERDKIAVGGASRHSELFGNIGQTKTDRALNGEDIEKRKGARDRGRGSIRVVVYSDSPATCGFGWGKLLLQSHLCWRNGKCGERILKFRISS